MNEESQAKRRRYGVAVLRAHCSCCGPSCPLAGVVIQQEVTIPDAEAGPKKSRTRP
jgi:hypothetical protein